MYYVYLIRSLSFSDQKYVGITENLESRLHTHNLGGSPHTSKFVPWELVSYVAIKDKEKAFAFEKYMKSHSGRAFASKRFW